MRHLRHILYGFILLISQTIYAQQESPYVLVLGVAQDGGYPHMGCRKECCNKAWANDTLRRSIVSLAVVDPSIKKWWLIEATPDIKEQLHYFQKLTRGEYAYLPEGIFITHAHIGHYTGLMQFGKEVMNTGGLEVYVLSRMKKYLETNGPWSQLVMLGNINLQPVQPEEVTRLSDNINIKAFIVPHRDEYSETAGFQISVLNKKYLFIPDIDKWNKWDRNIINEVKQVDIALLDGTFYDSTELPGKRMSEVPHPFVTETIKLFENEDTTIKAKIHFIHLNHTNPLLWDKGKIEAVKKAGFTIAEQGAKY